jgi:hypothetical protein
MEEFQPVQPVEPLDNDALDKDAPDSDEAEAGNMDGEASEEEMEVPFGLTGANFLCNVLQYAVFLGLTMVVLVIIRVFMPAAMNLP